MIFSVTLRSSYTLGTTTKTIRRLTSKRNLKHLYQNVFHSFVNVIDFFWFSKIFTELSMIYDYKFVCICKFPILTEKIIKDIKNQPETNLELELYYKYDQKYGIEFQKELETFVPFISDLKRNIDKMFNKTTNFKNHLVCLLDNFKSAKHVKEKYVFIFDKYKNLVFLNGMPKALQRFITDLSWTMSSSPISYRDIFKSPIINNHIDNKIKSLMDDQFVSDFLEHPEISISLIRKWNKGKFKGFSIIIDPKALIRLESHPEEIIDPADSLMNQKFKMVGLKQKRKRQLVYINQEKTQIFISNASRDNIENEDPFIESQKIPHNSKKEIIESKVGYERRRMYKAWSLRETIHNISHENLAINLENDNMLRRTSKKFTILDEIGTSYAMEFFPDNLNVHSRIRKSLVSDNVSSQEGRRKSYFGKRHISSKIESDENTLENFNKVGHLEKEIGNDVFVDWSYNVLNLSPAKELALVMRIFDPFLIDFSIDRNMFFSLVICLKRKYNKSENSFHNFHHGVSVAFSSNYFLETLPQFSSKIERHVKFAFLVAALAHDVGHTGKNNNYEINSRSRLALRYNDRSPLEQHHISRLFFLFYKHQLNIFGLFSLESYNEVRQIIIECILATDMKVHFSLLTKFESIIKKNEIISDKELKELSLCMLIHAGDISGSAKELSVASEWSRLVVIEFSNQYKLEVEKKLPVTAYFKDLHIPINFYKSEIGFLSFIVKPLYHSLVEFNFEKRDFGLDQQNSSNSLLANSKLMSTKEEGTQKTPTKISNPFPAIMDTINANLSHYQNLISSLADNPQPKVSST
jgi:hypothetical protein